MRMRTGIGRRIETGAGIRMRRSFQSIAVAVVLAWVGARAEAQSPACVGDCGETGTVAVAELITLVNIALGKMQPAACANGIPPSSAVDVTLLVQAVSNALDGCAGPAATATPTPATTTAFTPTATPSIGIAVTGGAYEYPLQFTPGAGYQGLVVAGYDFDGSTVVGNCSYYTVHSGSGRGGGYHSTKTYFNQTCTWDSYGKLLSVTPGAPVVPAPQFISDTRTVYAVNANGAYTGSDSALSPHHGFVSTPGSHYSWATPNAYAVLPQALYSFTATLVSDGDVPLHISSLGASALYGEAVVDSTTCIGEIAVGATCVVAVTYDPTQLRSATGLAYDTLDVSVASDSGQASDFTQSYTIALNSPSDD
jgi:hypothetical protein